MSARVAGIVLWLLAVVAVSAQAQTVEYLHTDALGSVVAVTDANRTVLERREYEPYGSQLTPAVSNGPGYTGHVQDAATGLVYMQQRYYDAQIGRFLSMDPVAANSGTGANFNRYWYADNNPYTFVDPTGMCTGSRIENKDGTCVSSGGNTTETYGAQQSTGSRIMGAVQQTFADIVSGLKDYAEDVRSSWGEWPGDGSLESNLAGLPILPIVRVEGALARLFGSVPGRVLTRINVSNAGWAHVLERHFAGTGSRFSITQAQLRSLLGSKQVVGAPIVRTLESADGARFVRQLDLKYTVGIDKFSGANTSILTVLSDEFGNLVTAFPGTLQ